MNDLPDGGPARAYPIRYLIWHEIVNDVVNGRPIAVTFCPLCNTGMVFDGRLDGQTLTFGVSGLLRHSDMIMHDHQTESWWQQALGVGIAGEMTGRELKQLPAWMESCAAFRTAHPEGLVLDEPNWRRAYGTTPYRDYDTKRPFLYSGEDPPHGIPPLERVVRVGDRAWPLTRLRTEGTIDETGLTLSWAEGQASALDTGDIAEGREVGIGRDQFALTDRQSAVTARHRIVVLEHASRPFAQVAKLVILGSPRMFSLETLHPTPASRDEKGPPQRTALF